MQQKTKNNHTFQKVLIILRRICSKMDSTLKLQLVFKITVMGLSFYIKLAGPEVGQGLNLLRIYACKYL